jgi:prophage regulatory protein
MSQNVLRLRQVTERTGLSRSTIYEYLAIGLFPPSIRLGKRAVGWVESEVTAWIDQRISLSRNTPQTLPTNYKPIIHAAQGGGMGL